MLKVTIYGKNGKKPTKRQKEMEKFVIARGVVPDEGNVIPIPPDAADVQHVWIGRVDEESSNAG